MGRRATNSAAVKNRKAFLAALSFTGASLALRARSDAQQSPSPAPSAAATPAREVAPPATKRRPKQKGPSAAALAVATTFRRFDSSLNDEDITTIARGIDDSVKAGASLNPKKKPLRNGDEPVTIFTVPG